MEAKRGRGRPSKLPEGKRRGVRLELVNGEYEKVETARLACGMSQVEFNRAAVLHCADLVNGSTPVHPRPKPPRKVSS